MKEWMPDEDSNLD